MSYAELLSDPRWQKRRLEIMDRDEWTCKACGDTQNTLTVHHKTYRKDVVSQGKPDAFRNPWDYGDADLITLCDTCHAKEEKWLKEISTTLYYNVRQFCEDASAIFAINDYISCLAQVKAENLGGDMGENGAGEFVKLNTQEVMLGFKAVKNDNN